MNEYRVKVKFMQQAEEWVTISGESYSDATEKLATRLGDDFIEITDYRKDLKKALREENLDKEERK